jgi:hypothetical protein
VVLNSNCSHVGGYGAGSPQERWLRADLAAHPTACTLAYWALNDRIAKTRAKNAALLMVRDHPEIAVHNNPAALGARPRVRNRDVSFGPRTAESAQAWETCMSLADTIRKLGVSCYHYSHDCIHGEHRIPPLADLID